MIDIKQFEGKTVSPRDDALIYDFLIGQSGIFEGCAVASLGANQLRISSGRGMIKGRVFTVEEEIILAQTSEAGARQGRLLIRLDVSNAETPISFATQVATALPPLVQEDINRDGSIYELSLATYAVNELQVSDILLHKNAITADAGAYDISVVLAAGSWQGTGPYTQAIPAPGIGSAAKGYLALTHSATSIQADAARSAMIRVTGQTDNSIQVTADGDKPGIDIPATITVVR